MMQSRPLPAPPLAITDDRVTSDADVLVVGITDSHPFGQTLQQIDAAGDGWLRRLADLGKAPKKKGETLLLGAPSDQLPALILLVGIGSSDQVDRGLAFESASRAIRKLADRVHEHVIIALPESFEPADHDAIVAGTLFGCEGTGIYQADPALHLPGMGRRQAADAAAR